jgi:hypothetical protein
MSKNVKIIIGVLAALFVGFIILVAVIAGAVSGGVKGLIATNTEAKDVGRAFTAEMAAENYEAAAEYVAHEISMVEGWDVSSLEARRNEFPIMDGYQSVSFGSIDISTINGQKVVMITGTLSATGDTAPITIELWEETDDNGDPVLRVGFWSLDPADVPVDESEDFDDGFDI